MTTNPKDMQTVWRETYLTSGSDGYLDDLYEQYLENPDTVDHHWRDYFASLLKEQDHPGGEYSHQAIREQFADLMRQSATVAAQGFATYADQQQEKVLELINSYRRVGHLQANIDPLGLYKGMPNPLLELDNYGFQPADEEKQFNVESFPSIPKPTATLAEIVATLQRVYSNTIGFEYMHITRVGEVEWIRERIEKGWANFKPSNQEKQRLLEKLVVADGLEKYLGFKYVGQKRFSLEGGDSLIPLLDTIVNHSAANDVKEIIIGMAHRGRLNVLTNVVGKSPNDIFAAFEGKGVIKQQFSGDVKYHLGYSSNVETPSGLMHLALAFNPSHLEIVSPVVQGSVRARQRRRRNTDQKQVLPIQIHGDAAFSAQGVVMETFSMSQARWFTVGGTVHIVINNQVGFTISDTKDSRSTVYCTDAAKMIEAPILHVNGNDPEAVYFAALFAIDYRLTFKRDVVIDLVCYRRQGHNEADEPSATQPLMYQIIKAMPVPYQLYAKQLIDEGVIPAGAEKKLAEDYRNTLDAGKSTVKTNQAANAYDYSVNWEPFKDQALTQTVNTGVAKDQLMQIAKQLEYLPADFILQPQVKKVYEARKKMTKDGTGLNWGYAETLAYASLLVEGYPIRLCGQDAARGTFAHRHAVLHDQKTDKVYVPLSHVAEKQAQINVVDSLLSEEGVLAFEYGYATAEPNNLVIWEAQFGDFANGAQVVIDQFISSGEQKWERLCGLVMLLPHGYEGQGPEHSSARLERYLQLCAQDNMQVCVPTTPAQIFHLLRRQLIRPVRKPLIVMTPKSLLRHPLATSTFDELTQGSYKLAIGEQDSIEAKQVERIVFCSGKIYYELLAKRREEKISNIALIRIEQLYPFPAEDLATILKPYTNAKEWVWCQEEPQNQGPWPTLQPYLNQLKQQQSLQYIGREASASPAVGYHVVHESEQEKVINEALMRRKQQ